MNDEERRYYDCFVGMDKFGQEHAGDFSGVGTAQFTLIHNIVNGIQQSGGELMAAKGEYSLEVDQKGLAREALREWMARVAATARGMVYAFPGIDEIFKMPRNRNDADLLTAARGFILEGATYNTDLQDYGMPATWIADGTALADAFETQTAEAAGAKADRVGKGALLGDWVVQGSRARRTLIAIVPNVYADNVELLAAWDTASHLEKASKSTPPTP